MRKRIYWLFFVVLMFVPMIASYVLLPNIVPVARRLFVSWIDRPAILILSDLLFVEGAVFLVFGALIGGTTLYNAWVPTDVRKAQFTDYIWNLKKIKEERDFPTGIVVGLVLIAVGVIYFVAAFLITP